jgi:hypothetical protein
MPLSALARAAWAVRSEDDIMARKTTKPAKADKAERGRWTVRGVPAKLQKAAGDAARAEGLTLGQWLSAVLDGATAGVARETAPSAAWEQAVERRLSHLEAAMLGKADTGVADRRLTAGSDSEPAA